MTTDEPRPVPEPADPAEVEVDFPVVTVIPRACVCSWLSEMTPSGRSFVMTRRVEHCVVHRQKRQ